jgi:hypothetical protein
MSGSLSEFGHLRAEPALECGSAAAALVPELARGVALQGSTAQRRALIHNQQFSQSSSLPYLTS